MFVNEALKLCFFCKIFTIDGFPLRSRHIMNILTVGQRLSTDDVFICYNLDGFFFISETFMCLRSSLYVSTSSWFWVLCHISGRPSVSSCLLWISRGVWSSLSVNWSIRNYLQRSAASVPSFWVRFHLLFAACSLCTWYRRLLMHVYQTTFETIVGKFMS